jgi:hypothetical protein
MTEGAPQEVLAPERPSIVKSAALCPDGAEGGEVGRTQVARDPGSLVSVALGCGAPTPLPPLALHTLLGAARCGVAEAAGGRGWGGRAKVNFICCFFAPKKDTAFTSARAVLKPRGSYVLNKKSSAVGRGSDVFLAASSGGGSLPARGHSKRNG